MPKPPLTQQTTTPRALPDATFLAGKLGRVYGIKGWLRVYSYTSPYTNLVQYRPWYVEMHQGWQCMTVTDCKPHGKALIAHFAGWDTPETSCLLTNARIAIARDHLPPLPAGEYYWKDLIGMKVYDLQQQYLGTVDHLFETGANDVLVLVQEGQAERWIPFVQPHIVQKVDLVNRIITVDWSE